MAILPNLFIEPVIDVFHSFSFIVVQILIGLFFIY